ncbi:MAG: hypothetical protein ACTHLN_14865, partial [Tepidisphaeraceae bacterium]
EEAQRRVRTAKAGSGERELARLDLRDMVWNRDHPNVHYDPYAGDRARQKRLGERFGRVSAFSAIAPLVAPAQAGGHGASATAGHPPAVNIAPSVGIDVAQVSQAVTAATKKGVKEAMQQVVNQQRDRNYANGVGGQL